MITIRPGTADDLPQANEILNQIILAGGTTAITDPMDLDQMRDWILGNPGKSAWTVAEDGQGVVQGFQWIGPWGELPEGAVDVGTFARIGQTQRGLGSQMFAATQIRARDLGYAWINANIRADNSGGLAFYQRLGFRDWGRKDGVVLGDGSVVSKVMKRFDLD